MYGIGLQLTSTTIIGGSYSPTSLFTANEVGYVYDLNDVTTLFKDTAGTQPVTTTGDAVALRLDKSRGLALGPELVTNGDFSSATGWTLQTGWSISGGLLVGNVAAAAFTNATTVAIPVAGRTYQVTYTVTAVTSGSVRLLFYGGTVVSGTIRSTVGTFTELLVANSGHSGLGFQGQGAGFVGTIDNVTVKELAGNHATQSDLTKRPLYSLLPSNGVRNLANGSAVPSDNTYWQAGPATANGITATRIGTGVDSNGLPYSDYTVSGTASALSFITLNVLGPMRTPAATGQTFTASFLGQIIAGTPPVVSSGVRAEIAGETAPSTFTEAGVGLVFRSATEGVSSITYTLANAATNQIAPAINVRTGAGETVNYTIRIKAFQLEVGSSRTVYQFNYAATNIVEPPFSQVGALLYDGINDFMVTSAVDFSGTDEVFLCHGVRKTSDAGTAALVELTNAPNTTNGSFGILAPNGTASPAFGWRSRGTTDGLIGSSNTFAAPVSAVVTGIGDISAPLRTVRVNGVQSGSETLSQGTGNYANAPVYFGSRGGTTFFFKGYEFSSICRSAFANPAQIASAEEWVRQRTAGAY